MIAPVGQLCWQGADSQCLQTSLIISQRVELTTASPLFVGVPAVWCTRWPTLSGCMLWAIFSLNATCRQVVAPTWPVLSKLLPVNFRPSLGSWFHCLQATSQ